MIKYSFDIYASLSQIDKNNIHRSIFEIKYNDPLLLCLVIAFVVLLIVLFMMLSNLISCYYDYQIQKLKKEEEFLKTYFSKD